MTASASSTFGKAEISRLSSCANYWHSNSKHYMIWSMTGDYGYCVKYDLESQKDEFINFVKYQPDPTHTNTFSDGQFIENNILYIYCHRSGHTYMKILDLTTNQWKEQKNISFSRTIQSRGDFWAPSSHTVPSIHLSKHIRTPSQQKTYILSNGQLFEFDSKSHLFMKKRGSNAQKLPKYKVGLFNIGNKLFAIGGSNSERSRSYTRNHDTVYVLKFSAYSTGKWAECTLKLPKPMSFALNKGFIIAFKYIIMLFDVDQDIYGDELVDDNIFTNVLWYLDLRNFDMNKQYDWNQIKLNDVLPTFPKMTNRLDWNMFRPDWDWQCCIFNDPFGFVHFIHKSSGCHCKILLSKLIPYPLCTKYTTPIVWGYIRSLEFAERIPNDVIHCVIKWYT